MTGEETRVAMVTGSGQGLGEAIARRLARAGMTVAVTDIDGDRAEQVAASIRDDGGRAEGLVCDVTSREQVETTVDGIAERHGGFHVLVSNAGVLRDNLLFKMSDDDWHAVIATHLTGAFYACRAAQRHMVRQKYGKIVLISSRAAEGNRGQTNYSAAKAGLQGMARSMALELGPFGINVNAVAPGLIETAMTHATAERMGLSYEEFATRAIERSAIKRVGQPDDVANTVNFLVSDEASYLTGQVLYVTGRPLQ